MLHLGLWRLGALPRATTGLGGQGWMPAPTGWGMEGEKTQVLPWPKWSQTASLQASKQLLQFYRPRDVLHEREGGL